MITLAALALSAALAGAAPAAAAATPPPTARDGADCDGNTIQLDACLSALAAAVDREHLRYVAAARAKLTREAADAKADLGPAKALAGFERAEAAWQAYREAECGAVYDAWSAGTIRGAMYETCQLRVTRVGTHALWLNWLTYMDSTPPVLPEPALPPAR